MWMVFSVNENTLNIGRKWGNKEFKGQPCDRHLPANPLSVMTVEHVPETTSKRS